MNARTPSASTTVSLMNALAARNRASSSFVTIRGADSAGALSVPATATI
jgi:hypothetical protein